jgi:ADP-heptose:LPS heptosyltransferase
MHIAAALGKPVLCFFGQSNAKRWHPWGAPYVLLQKPSLQARDITAAEAFAGFQQLEEKLSLRAAARSEVKS